MSSTPSQILSVIAPQFDALPGRDVYLEMAEQRTSKTAFGEKYAQAVALRAAHDMLLDTTRKLGETGSISSKSEGQLSVGFAAVAFGGNGAWADLAQTHFGARLRGLIRGSVLPAGVASGLPPGC